MNHKWYKKLKLTWIGTLLYIVDNFPKLEYLAGMYLFFLYIYRMVLLMSNEYNVFFYSSGFHRNMLFISFSKLFCKYFIYSLTNLFLYIIPWTCFYNITNLFCNLFGKHITYGITNFSLILLHKHFHILNFFFSIGWYGFISCFF